MHRFFVRAENIQGEEIVLSEQAHQIRDVLRLKANEHIIVLDNQGLEYEVVLTSISKNEVKGRVVEKREATGEPSVQITLYQSLLGREKFEWVLQKCTEIGVARFVPVVTGRSIVRDCDITNKKLGRWRRIIMEAAEQSWRGRVPELTGAVTLEQALDEQKGYGLSLIGSTAGEGVSLRKILVSCDVGRDGAIAVFVGPEGGFTEEEMRRGRDSGAIAFGLGRRILRTETAAVVACSVILYELGQMEM